MSQAFFIFRRIFHIVNININHELEKGNNKMRIYFEGNFTENEYKQPMINTAIFQLKNGEVITVDRDVTEYSEPGTEPKEEMVWHGGYIWDSDNEKQRYLNDDEASVFFKGSKFLGFEIEEDAGPDYKIALESVVVGNEKIEIVNVEYVE